MRHLAPALVGSLCIGLTLLGGTAIAGVPGIAPEWTRVEAPPVRSSIAREILSRQSPRMPGRSAVTTGTETEITAEIQALAAGLNHDPQLIYEYVRNSIEFQPFFGSMKGATAALLDGEGNSFDQSALMIALLRDSGFTASFIYGQVRIQAANIADLLGVAQDADLVGRVIASGGIPVTVWVNGGGALLYVDMDHVWVKVNVSGTDYVFDPSVKSHDTHPGIDLPTAMGYTQAGFLADAGAGATIDPDFVQNINRANIHADLASYATNLVADIRANSLGATLAEIIGGREIVRKLNETWRSTLTYERARYAEWIDVPASYMATTRIQHLGIDLTLPSAQTAAKRLTITYNVSFQPEVRLDGVVLATGTPATPGSSNSITLSVDHPYAANGGTYADQSVTRSLLEGGTYVIANDWSGTNRPTVERHRQRTRDLLAQGQPPTDEPLLGETLSVIASSWLAETFRSGELIDSVAKTKTLHHHTVGFCGQTVAPFIDIPMSLVSIISADVSLTNESAAFYTGAGISSAFEWGVFDQLQPITAVSTVKLIDFSNTAGDKIFDATSANYWTVVKPQLVNYDAGELALVESYINGGFRLVLPQNGNLNEGQWTGLGFISISPDQSSIGHIISGGLAGGFGTQPGDADPNDATTLGFLGYLWQQHLQSLEPVDLVSGDYLYSHTDLTAGSGDWPQQLAFTRHYSSAAREADGPIGRGWTHNFEMGVSANNDGFQGLGEDSPIDAAAGIAELTVAVDLYATSKDIQHVIASTLSHRWFVDRLIGNIVIVQEQGNTRKFVRLADGSFNPPPRVADELIERGDGSHLLTTQHGEQLDFDTLGQLLSWTDPNGNAVTFAYNAGLLTSATNSFGRSLNFTYSGTHISQVDDGTGRSVGYAYDVDNNLAAVTDPLANATTFEYDLPGRMTRVFYPANPLTPFVTNVYDGFDHVTTQTDGIGNVTSFFIAGTRTAVVDPSQATNAFYFDAAGSTVLTVDPLGNETSYIYDGQNRLVEKVEPEGNKTQFQYGSAHNVTQVTIVPKLNSGEPTLVKTYTYDPTFHRMTSFTDPLGRTTTFNYDASGNLTRTDLPQVGGQTPTVVYTNDSRGLVLSETSPEGQVNRYGYDPLTGDPTSIIEDDGGVALTWTMAYDNHGDMISRTDPRGNTTTFLFDDARRFIQMTSAAPFLYATRFTFDADGNMTTMERETGDPLNPWQITQFTYTNTGKKATEVDPEGHLTAWQYDPLDRPWRITDGNLNTVELLYDELGRLSSVADGRGITTQAYTYTANGKIATVTDGDGNITRYRYDGLDRLERTTFPDSSKEFVLAWDDAGNMLQKKLRSNDIVTYQYDELNRLTSTTWPGATPIQYAYDLTGKLLSVTDAAGAVLYQYDSAGRLTSNTDPDLNTVQYSYDANSNRTRLTYPDGYFVTYSYDSLNRLSDLLDQNSAVLVHYEYDPLSRRISSTYGDSTVAGYTYELDDDLAAIDLTHAGGTLSHTYTYDTEGNRLSMQDGTNTENYAYDGAYQLINVTGSAGTINYSFDGAGNRISMTDRDGATTSYTVNSLNQYTAVNAVPYSYDSLGRLTSDGVRSFGYDVRGNLESVTTPNRLVLSTFDALGRRVSQEVHDTTVRHQRVGVPGSMIPVPPPPPVVTNYIYDGTQVLMEVDAATSQLERRFVYGPYIDEPLVMIDGSGSYTYHLDGGGSVAALTDGTGQIAESLSRLPFGSPLGGPSAIGNPYSFTSRRYDADTGLFHSRARAYDPAIGRFLQPDPIGYLSDNNLYRYAGNNPVNLVDPSGLYTGVDDAVFAGVGALAGIASQGLADLISGQKPSLNNYVAAAVGGAVGGWTALYAPYAAGAAGGLAGSLTSQLLDDKPGIDAVDVALNTTIGALLGGIKAPPISGINAGRNSFGAITSQILTKLKNGTISSFSAKTAAKMAAFRGLEELAPTILGGEIGGILGRLPQK